MAAALPYIPAALGAAGAIIGGKGKEGTYSPMQDQKTNQARQQLYQYAQQMMKQGPAGQQPMQDAMSMLYSRFLPGLNYTQNQGAQPGGQQAFAPVRSGPSIGSTEWLRSRGQPQGGGIPSYAQGGIAWQPQIAQIAERGPEAVIPLQNMMGQGQPMQPGMNPQMQNMMGQMGTRPQAPGGNAGIPSGLGAMMAQLMRRRAGGMGNQPMGMSNPPMNWPYSA